MRVWKLRGASGSQSELSKCCGRSHGAENSKTGRMLAWENPKIGGSLTPPPLQKKKHLKFIKEEHQQLFKVIKL